MEFREVWQMIGELEGKTFRTDRGEEFSYRYRKTYVVVSTGEVSISRTNFEKVFRRIAAPETAKPVQGQRFITAILSGGGIIPAQD